VGFICFAAQALHTPVIGFESWEQTNRPQIGHVFVAGLPQMLHIPIIDIAYGKATPAEIKSS